MSRVPALEPGTFSAHQQQLYAAIAGPRGSVVRGPFAIWMRNPGIAEKANLFGNELRVAGKLDKRLFELMVLTIARHWSAQYEWFAHEKAALDAGLLPEVMEAIRHRELPHFEREDERVVHNLVVELNQDRALSDATYEVALATLGLDLLIELVTSAGFYTMVAMMLQAFDAPVPGGLTPLPP